jgi:hypothetical protein
MDLLEFDYSSLYTPFSGYFYCEKINALIMMPILMTVYLRKNEGGIRKLLRLLIFEFDL